MYDQIHSEIPVMSAVASSDDLRKRLFRKLLHQVFLVFERAGAQSCAFAYDKCSIEVTAVVKEPTFDSQSLE